MVAAVSFTWLGMVLTISFLEAPAKFRAPGVTVRLGVGIGRVVFRVRHFTDSRADREGSDLGGCVA